MSLTATVNASQKPIDSKQTNPLQESSSWDTLHKAFTSCTTTKANIIFQRIAATFLTLGGAGGIILAGLAIGGVIACPPVAAVLAAIIGVGMLAGGIALAANSCHIVDYQNPEVIAKLRQKALTKPLDALIEEHGLEKMFTYGIPLPEEFARLYKEKMDTLTLTTLIIFYEQVRSAHARSHTTLAYTIAEPKEWKHKWQEETDGKSVKNILLSYDFSLLGKYEILPPEELSLLKTLAAKIATSDHRYNVWCEEIRDTFNRQTPEERYTRDASLDRANSRYNAHRAHTDLRLLETQLHIERERIIDRADMKSSVQFAPDIDSIQYQKREALRLLEIEVQSRRASLQDALSAARSIRDREKRLAHRIFEGSTKTFAEPRDRDLRSAEGTHNRELSEINQEYRTFRTRA